MQQQSNGSSVMVDGRIVWTCGDLFAGKKRFNMQTKQPEINKTTGQQVVEYGFGLAVMKFDQNGQPTPMFQAVWKALYGEAMTLYPNGQVPPSFAMKFKDGDKDVDESGQPYGKREGYANHIVLACTTRLPIRFFRYEGGNNIFVTDGFKCGDYVRVQLNIKAHPAAGTAKAGLYLNPNAVQLLAVGKEIVTIPSGDALFGTNAPSYAGPVEAFNPGLPPQQGGGMPMPGQGQNPQGNYAIPNQGQQYQQAPNQGGMPMPGQNQQQQYQSNYNVLPNQGQQYQQAPNQGGMPMPGQGQNPQGNYAMPDIQNPHAQGGQWGGQVSSGQMPSPNGTTAQNGAYPSNNGMPPIPGR